MTLIVIEQRPLRLSMRHIPSHGGGLFCIHPQWKWEMYNDGAVLMHSEKRESSIILERPVQFDYTIISSLPLSLGRFQKDLFLLSKTVIMHRSVRYTNE